MHRGILFAALLAVALTGPVFAQATFEPQSPACTDVFPVGCGASGDPEGISWNGVGTQFPFNAGIDNIPNNCGFPTQGNQYLRVRGNGPVVVTAGVCPALDGIVTSQSSTVLANQVYIPIIPGASFMSFEWDCYDNDGPSFNDGCAIDIVDAACTTVQNLVCVDGSAPHGPCNDTTGACASFGSEVAATPGAEAFSMIGLPSNGVFLRVSAWNGGDNAVSPDCVVDNVAFAPPCLLSIAGVVNPGGTYTINVANNNCTPFTAYFTCLTVNANQAPNGYFFGISPFLSELFIQIATPVPPFNGILDASGASLFSATLPAGPIGIAIDGVTVEHVGFLPTSSTPAITANL